MKIPNDVDFLFVDHFDESLYKQALAWVGEGKRAAFISDDFRESENPRVKIYHLESPLLRQKIARQIAWSAVLQKMHVIGEMKEEIEELHLGAHLTLSEAAGYWVKPMENARANAGCFRRGMELGGAFKNVPAVIVGAGPSLEKNQHLLKELEKSALIFAGGSALSSIDVEPHFAAFIDADAPRRKMNYSDAAFCYQARMDSEIFSDVKGEKILFPDSSVNAINWLYGEDELFNGGWTVGNFLTQIACLLGCNPIIFVGMDFAYENGRKYAHIEGEAEVELIEVDGKLTQRDWVMAALWTQKKAVGREFLNASNGILQLKPFENTNFPEQKDLRKRVRDAVQALKVYQPNCLKEWDESLRKCKKSIELQGSEIVYQMLLEPLWQIWRPIFEREVELDSNQEIEQHKRLFFQNVLSEHE